MSGSTADETFRGTLAARTPEPKVSTTVIVTRHGIGHSARTWVTLAGSIRCTAVLTDEQVRELQMILTAARETRP